MIQSQTNTPALTFQSYVELMTPLYALMVHKVNISEHEQSSTHRFNTAQLQQRSGTERPGLFHWPKREFRPQQNTIPSWSTSCCDVQWRRLCIDSTRKRADYCSTSASTTTQSSCITTGQSSPSWFMSTHFSHTLAHTYAFMILEVIEFTSMCRYTSPTRVNC